VTFFVVLIEGHSSVLFSAASMLESCFVSDRIVTEQVFGAMRTLDTIRLSDPENSSLRQNDLPVDDLERIDSLRAPCPVNCCHCGLLCQSRSQGHSRAIELAPLPA
jgi:hypothetical protein